MNFNILLISVCYTSDILISGVHISSKVLPLGLDKHYFSYDFRRKKNINKFKF